MPELPAAVPPLGPGRRRCPSRQLGAPDQAGDPAHERRVLLDQRFLITGHPPQLLAVDMLLLLYLRRALLELGHGGQGGGPDPGGDPLGLQTQPCGPVGPVEVPVGQDAQHRTDDEPDAATDRDTDDLRS